MTGTEIARCLVAAACWWCALWCAAWALGTAVVEWCSRFEEGDTRGAMVRVCTPVAALFLAALGFVVWP